MAKIPGAVVEEVRSRIDIVELISSYIELKKAGKNYVALCPFHSEKTPSFSVSPEKQIYYCFGCNSGGNVFGFVMQMENITFPEAVRLLSGRAGVSIDYEQPGPEERRAGRLRENLYKIMSLAQNYFQKLLWESPKGREVLNYLYRRGIEEQAIKQFALGYAADSWDGFTGVLRKRGIDLELAYKGGLAGKKHPHRYYDYFRGRLMFPIADHQGRTIGFGGRTLGQGEPKYLNSPETPLFDKSRTLYGLHLALPNIRREKEALLVEGYMDVILLHQHGINTAVAPLGTSLTASQVSLLRGRMDKITLAFDADSGGERAALRSLDLLKKEGCRVNVAQLPEGQDPADYISRHAAEEFRREIMQKASPLFQFRIQLAQKKYDLQKKDDRIDYWKEVRKILADIPEVLEREEYLKKIASEIGVSLEVLREDLEKTINSFSAKGRKHFPEDTGANRASVKELAEKELLACLIHFPTLGGSVWEKIKPEHFTSGSHQEIAECLYSLSQKGGRVETAALLSYFSSPEMHKLIMDMSVSARYEDESRARKTIKDCLKRMKSLHLAEERESLIRSLQDGMERKELSARLKKIHDLKKLEEELYRSGEGEDFDG